MIYIDLLRQAWQEHLLPRRSDAPTTISLFAGGGGSSLGMSMAGYRELLAVEWNDVACKTYRLNLPDVDLYQGDIAALSVDECLQRTHLATDKLDVLEGSPPCQGFSTSGKRKMYDSRNRLFEEYVRLLCGLRPKVFVMENTSGLVKGKMKLIFAEMFRALKTSGYHVVAKLLDFSYFDVPQRRERVIFIGIREDLHILPTFPKTNTIIFTVGDALANLIGEDLINPEVSERVLEMMRTCPQGTSLAQYLNVPRYFSWKRPSMKEPCNTITKQLTFGGFAMWHPIENRPMSAREIARVSSWPDETKLYGNFKDWVACIGNSVPPLFMKRLGEHIRISILSKIDKES